MTDDETWTDEIWTLLLVDPVHCKRLDELEVRE